MTLRQKIEQEIRQRGPIAFSRYMEMCLYDPDLGYYSRNTEQFGKAGDFYTSSDVHAVFGRLLARQFEEMWRVLGSPAQIEVLELGPGRGLIRSGCTGLVGEKVSRLLSSPALQAGGDVACFAKSIASDFGTSLLSREDFALFGEFDPGDFRRAE